jgi:hypothetical protein
MLKHAKHLIFMESNRSQSRPVVVFGKLIAICSQAGTLVSACLMGNPVRYDGQHRLADSEIMRRWQREGRLVTVFPARASLG